MMRDVAVNFDTEKPLAPKKVDPEPAQVEPVKVGNDAGDAPKGVPKKKSPIKYV